MNRLTFNMALFLLLEIVSCVLGHDVAGLSHVTQVEYMKPHDSTPCHQHDQDDQSYSFQIFQK